jgi:hypothetical protein
LRQDDFAISVRPERAELRYAAVRYEICRHAGRAVLDFVDFIFFREESGRFRRFGNRSQLRSQKSADDIGVVAADFGGFAVVKLRQRNVVFPGHSGRFSAEIYRRVLQFIDDGQHIPCRFVYYYNPIEILEYIIVTFCAKLCHVIPVFLTRKTNNPATTPSPPPNAGTINK